jgi:hypothetical protein
MTDLVQRLRRMCGNDPNTIVTQAADRIEQLWSVRTQSLNQSWRRQSMTCFMQTTRLKA